MSADTNEDEVLSIADILARLRSAESDRSNLALRVKDLENQLEAVNIRHDLRARKREQAILLNAANAIAQLDRYQQEREDLLNSKLKRAEEECLSVRAKEQDLERQLTQTVIAHNSEIVTQARFDDLKNQVEDLERERERLRSMNIYLKQVLENVRVASAKSLRNKSIQTETPDCNPSLSKGLQAGKSHVKQHEKKPSVDLQPNQLPNDAELSH